MSRKKQKLDYNDNYYGFNPRELSLDQKQQYLRKIVERANKRITRINQSGRYSHAYAITRKELERQGRKRFSYKRPKTEHEINREIVMVESFLNMETSLVSNVKRIQQKAYLSLKAKLARKGYANFEINQNDFYRFMSSQEFKDMAADYGSNWVVEDIAKAVEGNRKITIDELVEQYKEFMREELPIEAVHMKRSGAISSYDEYRKLRDKQRQGL